MIYEYLCEICGKQWDEVKPYSERYDVFCCNSRATKLLTRNIYTEKDLAYKHVDFRFGKPVEIRSKGQYKRMLKQNGLADGSIKECNDHALFRKKINEESSNIDRKNVVKKMANRMRDDGVLDAVPGFMKDVLKVPIGKEGGNNG